MFSRLRKVNPTIRRYVVVGVLVYFFEIAVLILAQQLGASALVAVTFSFWLGLVVSFLLQKLVTFKDKRLHRKIVLVQFLAACALVLWNFLFTLLVTKILESVIPAALTRTLALGVTTIWNFYLYKTRIFKQPPLDPLVS